jgi:hemoglobin-like flavoprotein
MDPSQVKLVQESFAKVAPISGQAAAVFYDRLFEVAPAVKAMFPADMTEQRKKLMGTLAAVVNGLSDLESILPAASALAKRHVGTGQPSIIRGQRPLGRWEGSWRCLDTEVAPGPRPMARCPTS